MKLPYRYALLIGSLVFSALLAGCAASTMSRINSNRKVYESWPVEIREAVLDGRVVKGMTPEMVRMSKGNPARIRKGENVGEDEVWVYGDEDGGQGRAQISMGGNLGPVSVSGARPVGGRGPDDGLEVIFKDGVVVKTY